MTIGDAAETVDPAAARVDDLAFRARALAQAHPLSSVAHRYLVRALENERGTQPMPEIAEWAGAAFTKGYCVRRVEERDGGAVLETHELDDDALAAAAADAAAALRSSTAAVEVVDALDRVIASEVENRLEQWRDDLAPAACVQLEDYLTWWAVEGYAIRVAETGGRR